MHMLNAFRISLMQENKDNAKTENELRHHFLRNKLCVIGFPVRRLKQSEISEFREMLIKEQNQCCALCGVNLKQVVACLDHDHRSGSIRNALCNNCNGIEGKIYNLANRAKRNRTVLEFLCGLIEYIKLHQNYPFPVLHPLHRTEDEKRIKRNAKAREARARRTERNESRSTNKTKD